MRTLRRPLKEWLLAEDPLGIAPAFPQEEVQATEIEEVERIEEEEPSASPPPTPSRTRRSPGYLLGLIILLLLAGGGFFYYHFIARVPRISTSPTPLPSASPTRDQAFYLRFGPFSTSPTLPVPPPQGAPVTIEVQTETVKGTIYLLARPVGKEVGERIVGEMTRLGVPVTFDTLPEGSYSIRSLPLVDAGEKRRFQEVVATFGESLREGEGEVLIPRYFLWVGPLPPGPLDSFLEKLPPDWRRLAQRRTEPPR